MNKMPFERPTSSEDELLPENDIARVLALLNETTSQNGMLPVYKQSELDCASGDREIVYSLSRILLWLY
ncbi:MAG: hypothetical protein F6K47_26120 [Symploca sp. SIO2E6]|nr:hypothetical protein [Symploca sp. SIO2E6]